MSSRGGRSLVALLVVLVMVMAAGPPGAEAAIRCSRVYAFISPCLGYLRVGGAIPRPCCGGIRNLVFSARTRSDRRSICVCLKTAGAGLSGAKLSFATTLPAKCRVVSPFKISPSLVCSKVK